MSEWDVIVIGSGIGGLGGAVALSNLGQKVLVLEQHYLPGGWCHTFALDGHKFSPGVHYIGQLQEGGQMRKNLEGLGVAEDLEFMEINPDGFDHVVFDDETFDIPRDQNTFRQRLIDRFPSEANGINRYFNLMNKVNDGFEYAMQAQGLWGKIKLLLNSPAFVFSGLKTLASVVDRHVKDPKLKAILESRAGDHGTSPDEVPFLLQVAVDAHYWDGAWFPKGGGGAIPRAFIKRLKKTGGEIRTRCRVKKILIDDGRKGKRAIGVELDDGEVIRAKTILSNADVWMTYQKLVGRQHIRPSWSRRIDQLKPSVSALSLFMAADIDAEKLGLDSGNYWILNNPDVSSTYRQAHESTLDNDGPFPGAFLTITTKKDPTKMCEGLHSLEAFVLVSYDAFQEWKDSSVDERPDDYVQFKKQLTERMLDTIDVVIPNLREHLKLCELGTPLTNDFYVAAHRGNLYGHDKLLSQIGPGAPPIRTEIEGLFHCGQSTAAHGVLGALSTGLEAASQISGVSMEELLAFNEGQTVKCYSFDQVREFEKQTATIA